MKSSSGSFKGNKDNKQPEGITFYYNREERLKKLHRIVESNSKGFFKTKRSRRLLILFIDIIIIAVVLYVVNKPTNVYEKKIINNVRYELNVSGIRGKKVMFAVTIKNVGSKKIYFGDNYAVILKISGKKGYESVYKKYIRDINIETGEITSVVFLIEESKLPKYGEVEVFVDDIKEPIFKKNIRFYYYKL